MNIATDTAAQLPKENADGVRARSKQAGIGAVYGKLVQKISWLISRVALPVTNGAISAVIIYQVVARYLFNAPSSWAEELALISMTWMVFLGLVMTLERGQEITLTGALRYAGQNVQRWLAVLRKLLVLAFLCTLLYQSVYLAYFDRFSETGALELSWTWIYLAVSVGVFLYLLLALPSTLRDLAKEKLITTVVASLLVLAYFAVTKWGVTSVLGFQLVWLMPVLVIVLMVIEVPVGFALGIACFYYLIVSGGIPLSIMPLKFTHGINSYTIMALPLFILAAELMNEGGITERIIALAMNLVGHLRGGMGHVTVAANMIMAGISGSALADTAATGSILIPEMEKKGFSRPFASAVVAASGTIGPMIPPSIFFIIYGGLANVSILKLFLAGAIPGVLMGIFLMVVVYMVARRRNYPVEKRASLGTLLRSIWNGLPAIAMPIFIIWGMIGGVFTATEAGAVAVLYGLVLGLLYRRLNLSRIWGALSRTAITVAAILVVLSMANLVTYIANRTQVPQVMLDLLMSVSSTPWVVLLIVNLFLLALGCFEAVMPTLIVATPILVPALSKLGIDPVHFGVVMTLNLLIGLLTPPFGASLFLICSIAKVGMRELIVETWPFIVALLILLALITYVPEIVLFLPNALG